MLVSHLVEELNVVLLSLVLLPLRRKVVVRDDDVENVFQHCFDECDVEEEELLAIVEYNSVELNEMKTERQDFLFVDRH